MESENKILKDLIKFRALMGVSLSSDDIKDIWGKSFLKEIKSEEGIERRENKVVDYKVKYAKENIKFLKIFNWVKFVGISGSVGAGFAKEGDDIDVFIVVRDGTAWIYRGILSLWNIFHNRIRTKRNRIVKDKFCINLISEERGLAFESDIFNFHELMFLIPLFNETYLNFIYSKNSWLRRDYFVKKELLFSRINEQRNVNIFIRFLNWKFYILQILFMLISNHNPDIKRIRENYKRGRIEFFPESFKIEKIEKYLNTV